MAEVEKIIKKNGEIIYKVYPDINKDIDYKGKEVHVEISLPGVKKEDISLKTLPSWFKISAKRDTIEYNANCGFGVEIVPEKTTAEYSNGLLKVSAIIKDPMDEALEVSF